MFGMSYQQPIISSIRLENLEVSAQQAADDAAQVKIDVQGLHDLTLQYRNDAQFYFEQVQQFQAGDFVTTSVFNDTLAAFSFSDLASVPSEYNPSAHRHSWSELDDVPLTFAPSAHRHDWSDLDNVPVEFEPAEHVHTWQQVSGKPATFPPEIHVHDWSEIQNKPAAFMPVAHQHSWADITGKPSTYTPSAHTHDWSGIQNKPDLLVSGSFGFGGTTEGVQGSFNNVNKGAFLSGSDSNANAPDWLDAISMPGIHAIGGGGRGLQMQTARSGRFGYRTQYDGIWDEWKEFWHTGNLIYAQNRSGATVGNNGAISGSNLNPPQSGTWSNVSNNAVGNNGTCLWKKV